MTETLGSLIGQAKQSRFSQVSQLSEEEFMNVWVQVSSFIKKQLYHQKGASISELGVFIFSKKVDVGSSKVSRPMFVLNEKLAQLHSLKKNRPHMPGNIPVVPLNFTVISNELILKREVVESAVKEVILALSHSLAANKNIELEFSGFGKLLITDKKVQMKFYKEFIASLDSTGEIGKAFSRCNTASSLITGPATPQHAKQGYVQLPTITEHQDDPDHKPKPPSPLGHSLDLDSSMAHSDPSEHVEGCHRISNRREVVEPQQHAPRSTQSKQSLRQPLSIPTASGVFYGTSSHPTLPSDCKENPGHASHEEATAKHCEKPSTAPQTSKVVTSLLDLPLLKPASTGSRQRTRSLSPSQERVPAAPGPAEGLTGCHDLCYICHQRAQRNVSLSIVDRIKRQEILEDKAWQLYQKQQLQAEYAKEKAKKMDSIKHATEVSAFNYGASTVKKEEKKKKTTDFYPSYVFQHRESTPPKKDIQQVYCSQLDEQVTQNQHKSTKEEDARLSWEQAYQKQLVTQLAQSEETFYRDKAQNRALYQKALAEQVAIRQEIGSMNRTAFHFSKPDSIIANQPMYSKTSSCTKLLPLPLHKPLVRPFSSRATIKDNHPKMIQAKDEVESHEPVQPLFGVIETVPNPKVREREEARALSLEQYKMATEKQKLKKEKIVKAQTMEAEMLQKTKKELLEDIETAHRDRIEVRKKLEKLWSKDIELKQKQLEEYMQRNKDTGILLLDQCARYKRCKQCQRKLNNMGNVRRLGTTV